MDLGQRLQMCREAKKVTQAEMAKACNLSKNYISAIERGVKVLFAQSFPAVSFLLPLSGLKL